MPVTRNSAVFCHKIHRMRTKNQSATGLKHYVTAAKASHNAQGFPCRRMSRLASAPLYGRTPTFKLDLTRGLEFLKRETAPRCLPNIASYCPNINSKYCFVPVINNRIPTHRRDDNLRTAMKTFWRTKLPFRHSQAVVLVPKKALHRDYTSGKKIL